MIKMSKNKRTLPEKYSKEWVSREEYEKLITCEKIKPRDILLIRFIYGSGMRISEVLDVKRTDLIKEENRTYTIIKKQKKDKKNWEKQPIPPEVYSEAIRYCNDKNIGQNDYIFYSQMSKRMTRQRAWQIMKESKEKAGILKDITNHSFRRSRLTHLLETEMDSQEVMRFARHKTSQSLDPYIKLAKKDIFDKMNQADGKKIDEGALVKILIEKFPEVLEKLNSKKNQRHY